MASFWEELINYVLLQLLVFKAMKGQGKPFINAAAIKTSLSLLHSM